MLAEVTILHRDATREGRWHVMAKASRTHATTPSWTEDGEWPRFPPLDADTHAHVVVVGCGITGLTAACLLTAEGRAVVLLEHGRCVQAETAHTSAHFTM